MRGMCHTRDVLMCGNLCGIQIARRKESIFPEPEDVKDFPRPNRPTKRRKERTESDPAVPLQLHFTHAREGAHGWSTCCEFALPTVVFQLTSIRAHSERTRGSICVVKPPPSSLFFSFFSLLNAEIITKLPWQLHGCALVGTEGLQAH